MAKKEAKQELLSEAKPEKVSQLPDGAYETTTRRLDRFFGDEQQEVEIKTIIYTQKGN
jgi:hypothetical protein